MNPVEESPALTEADRAQIIEQLRALLAGRSEGLDLDTPIHSAIQGLDKPGPFFEHLPILLPPGSILYVEGCGIAADVAAFYAAHRAPDAVEVVRDTLWPVPDIYHLSFSDRVSSCLRQLSEQHPVEELFDHLKAYRGNALLLYFHDAFAGTLRIASHIPEGTVGQFCRALGVASTREETGRRDPEILRKVLWSFEHPDRPEYPTESKFGRLWRRLTGKQAKRVK